MALIAIATWLLVTAPALGSDGTRDAMHVILKNIQTLLGFSVSLEEFTKPANTDSILASSRALEDQAYMLAEHTREGSAEEFFAQTLERYAFLLARSFELGKPEEARRLVFRMTDICIACHTRVPSPNDSPLAGEFTRDLAMNRLPDRERALLEIATRQFNTALATLERFLASPQSTPDEIDDALLTYLVVALRVKTDTARVEETLRNLIEQGNLPDAAHRQAVTWLDVLLTSRMNAPDEQVIDVAEAYIRNGERRDEQAPGYGMLDYVLASGLLHRYLSSASVSAPQRSRANYLLGVTEYMTTPGHWLPQTELYLETAIIQDPSSESAWAAYELLREKLAKTFGGEVPVEVQEHMNYLHELLVSQQAQ